MNWQERTVQNGKTKKRKTIYKKNATKLLAVFAFILLFLIIILLRIVYINVKSGNSYAKQVLSQEDYDSKILYSRRGEIQDKNGRLLAYSEKVYNVNSDCYEINLDEDQIEPTIEVLEEVFKFDSSDLRDRITSEKTRSSRYQVVLKEITETQKEEYEEYVSLDSDRELSTEELKEAQNVTGVVRRGVHPSVSAWFSGE